MEKLFRTEFVDDFLRLNTLTKLGFCQSSGISLQDFDDFMQNKSSTTVETLLKIAKSLDVHVVVLFHLTEKEIKYKIAKK